MTKLVCWMSFTGLAVLLIFGLIAPSSSVMWLASTTPAFAFLRAGLMLMLFTLLITEPPRNAYLRAVVGMVSTVLVVWSLSSAYQNKLPLEDAMILLATGLSAGITVLERRVAIEIPDYILPQRAIRARNALRKLSHA